MLAVLLCLLAIATASPLTDEAHAEIQHAVTYQTLSQLSGYALPMQEASTASFDRALAMLEGVEGAEAERLRAWAAGSRTQSIHLEDHAHDSVRNIVPAAWILVADDPIVELLDDPWNRAMENGLAALDATLAPQIPTRVVPTVLRVHHAPWLTDLPDLDDRDLDERRDNLKAAMLEPSAEWDRLMFLEDSWGAELLPQQWPALAAGDDTPLPDLATALGAPALNVLDLLMVDQVETPDGTAVRIDLTLSEWRNGQIVDRWYVRGAALDQRARSMYWLWWGLLMVALGTVLVAWQRHSITSDGLTPPDPGTTAVVGIAVFLLGAGLGAVAGQFSGEYLAAFNQLGLFAEVGPVQVPLPDTVLWSTVHGTLTMVAPMLLLAWGSQRLPSVVLEQLGDPVVQLRVIAPLAQAGAAWALFTPLLAIGTTMQRLQAVILTACALGASAVLARPMAMALRGQLDGAIVRSLVAGLAALAVLLPVGLLHGLLPLGLTVLLSVTLAVMSWRSLPRSAAATTPHAEPSTPDVPAPTVAMGTLEHPTFVDLVPGGVDALITELGRVQVASLTGPPGSGLSRTLDELQARWRTHHERPHITSVVVAEDHPEPFHAIVLLLRRLGIADADLWRAREMQAAQVSELVGALDDVADMVPGLSLVFGLMAATGTPTNTALARERVLEDATDALTAVLPEGALVVVQFEGPIDTSSREVLERAVERGGAIHWLFAFRDAGPVESWTPLRQIPMLRVALDALPEGDTRLLEACGVRGVAPELRAELVRLAHHRPRYLHDILCDLRDTALLTPGPDHTFETAATLDGPTLAATVPATLVDRERQRITELPKDAQRLLEVAALCGRSFTVTEVAVGLGISPFAAAEALRTLEDDVWPPMVEDLDQQEDVARFATELTREVLLQGLTRHHRTSRREMQRVLHASITDAWANGTPIPLHRVVRHASRAGDRYRQTWLEALAAWAETLYTRRAWPELLMHVQETHIQLADTTALKLQLGSLRARALRFAGGQANRDQALQLLEPLLATLPHDNVAPSLAFRATYVFCEAFYEEKQKSDLETLHTWCTARQTEAHDPLVAALHTFYRHITPEPTVDGTDALPPLATHVEQLPPSPERDLLLSMVLQQHANLHMRLHKPRADDATVAAWVNTAWRNVAEPQLQRAHDLKVTLNDQQGLAMNLGLRGNHHLFTSGDPEQARALLLEDLAVIERNGFVSDRSGLLNRLSMAGQQLADRHPEAAEAHLNQAADHAIEALTQACELDRESDMAFAAGQVVKVVAHDGCPPHRDALTEALSVLGNPALWSAVPHNVCTNVITRPGLKHLVTNVGHTYAMPERAAQVVEVLNAAEREAQAPTPNS